MKLRVLGAAVAALVFTASAVIAGPANAVPWPERPSDEGWVQDVTCASRYSATRDVAVLNLSSVPMTLGVRGIDCFDWSNTGNPAQITGTVVPNAQRAPTVWSLEPNRWARHHAFGLGFFLRKPNGTLAYRGKTRFSLSSVHGELVDETNTGRKLHPHREGGYQCRQVSLGRDPHQWRTRTDFFFPLNVGAVGRLVTIYSDGERLHAVRCHRNDSAAD